MRLSIRLKVLIAVSVSLVLIFVLITYLLVQRNTGQLSSSLNEQSKSFASLATPPIGNTFTLYKDSGTIRITQQVNNFLELDPDVTAIEIVGVDGKVLYSSIKDAANSVDPKLAGSFKQEYVANDKGYIEKVIQPYFEDSGAHRYSVIYQISTKRIEQSINEVVKLIVYIGLIILLISIAATVLLLNRLFIKPLKEVSKSANIISSGDFDHQITSKRQDEIGDLANSMDKMANFLKADIVKLRDLDKMKNEFMMITSHNLRTPITIMQGYIELASTAKSVDELKGIVSTIQESVVRLHLLAENVLSISTLEAGEVTLNKSPTPLYEFVNAIGKEFGLIATKKNLKWSFSNTVPVETRLGLSPTNMRSALGNFIDNSIKFTKAGGFVSASCSLAGNEFVFKVADSGVGISQEEMPKLFTKFHRGTSTMSYDYEGIGIGLYLSKLIIEQHGGRIEVQSELNKGTTFIIYLPLSA